MLLYANSLLNHVSYHLLHFHGERSIYTPEVENHRIRVYTSANQFFWEHSLVRLVTKCKEASTLHKGARNKRAQISWTYVHIYVAIS